jgi:hypothetical protein
MTTKGIKIYHIGLGQSILPPPLPESEPTQELEDHQKYWALMAAQQQQQERPTATSNRKANHCSGVVWNKRQARWNAYIQINGRTTNLGYFDDWFEAVCARKSAGDRKSKGKTP